MTSRRPEASPRDAAPHHRTSDSDAVISEKNDLWCCPSAPPSVASPGGSSKTAGLSQSAADRMSQTRAAPRELAWAKSEQCAGWNSAAVMTSVKSSMHAGFMSTMTKGAEAEDEEEDLDEEEEEENDAGSCGLKKKGDDEQEKEEEEEEDGAPSSSR